MECNDSKDNEFVVDIESLESRDEAQATKISNSGKKWLKKSLSKIVGGGRDTNIDLNNVSRGSERSGRLQNREDEPLVHKSPKKDRQMAGKVHKHPKPPRPPKGPTLDAADMRLMKHISKIALKRRERIQALNELRLRRMNKPAKKVTPPSSITALSAMVVTVLFLFILVFQGLSSSGSTVMFVGAPQPTQGTTGSPTSTPHRSRFRNEGV